MRWTGSRVLTDPVPWPPPSRGISWIAACLATSGRPAAASAGAGAVTGAVPPVALDAAMGRYAEGDDAAFAAVHAGLAPRLRLFLLRLAKSPPVADDLLQETFLRMHRARASFAVGARALPWAYAIARSVYVDHVRARAVRKESLAERDEPPGHDVPSGSTDDGEQVSIARQTAAQVEEVLARLPVNQREAFVLVRYEGLSIADAARVLGATEGAVKLRAFHAYEALRKALDMDHRKRGASR